MAILDDIASYLAAQSTAFTVVSGTGGNLAKSVMLDAILPDTITVIYEAAGLANEYVFSTSTGTAGVANERPSFQILSRSTSYVTARTRAQTAYTILDGLAGKSLPTATGTLYLEIVANQAPFSIGRDDNERYLISTNYTARKAIDA